MADKNGKDSTPPPLLLMPASEGLTLSSNVGASLLMPVPQSGGSIMQPEDYQEDGEADSFVGQTPPNHGPFSYFSNAPVSSSHDPFAEVVQPDLRASPQRHTPTPPNTQPLTPASSLFTSPVPTMPPVPPSSNMMSSGPVSEGMPPASSLGSAPMMTPINSGTSTPQSNQFRMSGTPRYAQPPPGTYAGQGSGSSFTSPLSSSASLGGLPSMSGMPTGGPPPPLAGSIPTPQHTRSLPTCAPPPMFPGGPPQRPPMPSGLPGPPPPSSTSGPSVVPMMPSPPGVNPIGAFTPVMYHWFYCKNIELRQIWQPFSITDSIKLEEVFRGGGNGVVCVEGGRYDVVIGERTRHSVYWEEDVTRVRRCSWFFKPDGETRYVPYEEHLSEKLEDEYKSALAANDWHKRIELEDGETVIMHNANVIVHFKASPDEWGTVQGDASRPKVVRRGIDDFDTIEDGESSKIDHIVFVVHGIGSTCDLRFRNIVECVDDFRTISLQMLKSHFERYQDEGRIGRVEFLPVRWHNALHGDATGIDKRLKAITLGSIGKLRHFTNDTLLDILFYSSPAYCQKISETVGSEINRLYQLFLTRNTGFKGAVSVAGHSLGSLILFDLLCHQGDQYQAEVNGHSEVIAPAQDPSRENTPSQDDSISSEAGTGEEEKEEETVTLSSLLKKLNLNEYEGTFEKEQIDMDSIGMLEDSDLKDMGLPMGPRKKLQGYLKLQKAKQKRKKEEADKKARLESQRQVREEALKLAQENAQNELSALAAHDPLLRSASNTSVNYVVGGSGTGIPLVKHPQLDFQPVNFFALGSPIAMFQTVRGVEMLGEEFKLPSCPGFFNIFHPFDPVAYRVEPLLTMQIPPKPVLMPHHKGRKRLHLELKESLSRMGSDIKQRIIDSVKITWKTINDFALAHRTNPQDITEQDVDSAISQITSDQDETGSIVSSMPEEDVLLGQLNQGRRVDYVLQEKPIESFNDYLFALGSHACYWESEDTLLFILKEIYAAYGIAPIRPGQEQYSNVGPPPRMYSTSPPIGSSPVHPTGLGTPPTGLGAPPNSFGVPPTAFNAPPTTYGGPSPNMIGHPMTGPPMGMPGPSMTPPPASGAPPTHNAFLPPPRSGFVRK